MSTSPDEDATRPPTEPTSGEPPPPDREQTPSAPPAAEHPVITTPSFTAGGIRPVHSRLVYLAPAVGCLAILCVALAGLGGLLWSGVPAQLLATNSSSVVMRVVKVARIGPDGQYYDDSAPVFRAANQGMAGRVVYERVPRGYRGEVIISWERVETSGASTELRKPEVIPISETMNGTTWWYALRQPFPAGQYQFRVALAQPGGSTVPVGSVRFEVRPDGAPPPGGPRPESTPTPSGYRPPTPPQISTPPPAAPSPSPAVATATATSTPPVVTTTPTPTPLIVTATPTPSPVVVIPALR